MNKPLEDKHVANENTFEEEKLSTSEVNTENTSDMVSSIKEQENMSDETVKNADIEVQASSSDVIIPEEQKAPETEIVLQEKPDSESKSEETTKAVEEQKVNQEELTKEQIIDKLNELIEQPINDSVKSEIEELKQAFYKKRRVETEEAKKNFVVSGGKEEDFVAESDEFEEKIKNLLQTFREKKATLIAENEKVQEENLVAKKEIIEKIKELIESQDDFYKVYNEFRKLQQQWKEIKVVPLASVNDLWKEYQHYSEKFYDLLKINNEMRDYDFKKNLELKTSLCESVERLESESDVISAFYQLQNFHQEWREIGPVARELREDIWNRFKKASTVINKRHQEHFEALRKLEERNLEEKTQICEEMETIDYDSLQSFKDWDDKSKRVLELQEKWKTIGFAPKKYNVKIFERFRAACDVFFQRKSDFYKGIKEEMDVNLEKKKVLCEKAEALKDSQDWKETTDKLIALQKEWKTVGPVSRKHSDVVWKRFITACDYFFEQKNIHFSSQKTEEVENLKLKRELIDRINAIDSSLSGQEAMPLLRELMAEWNSIGFVPFREKDKIYKDYREAVDKHFDRLKVDESERRLQSFKSNLNDIKTGERAKNKILSEREKLMRTYERLKGDIQTYENNIGFLSVSSKGGGGLVKEMTRKIESLKEELGLILKKIEVIDENLEQDTNNR